MAVKGKTNNPNGRPKGVPNKSTTKVRNAISQFAEDTVEEFTSWLQDIALEDKKAAADLWLKTIEYHIPKLARTENSNYNVEDKVEDLNEEDQKIIRRFHLEREQT